MTLTTLDVLAGSAALLAGLVTLMAGRRLATVVSFLVFGVLLTLVWARLAAPDVALAEMVIGTGVTAALLIDGATRRPDQARATGPSRWLWLLPLVLAVPVALGLAERLVDATGTGVVFGTGRQAVGRAAEVGVDYPVTSVLLGFRAFDTLLEIAVLLGAAVVVRVLAPVGPVSAAPARERSPLLQGFIRGVGALLALVTCWFLFAGSSRPGGAFQAGAMLAAVLIVLHASGVRRLDPAAPAVRVIVGAGLGLFLAVAALGPVTGAGWLTLPSPVSGPVIVVLEAVLTVTIGVSLAAMFLALARPAGRGTA